MGWMLLIAFFPWIGIPLFFIQLFALPFLWFRWASRLLTAPIKNKLGIR